jgi:glyoxylase-like metal-dependent hydrolase (beta-lactamase superfamily II)
MNRSSFLKLGVALAGGAVHLRSAERAAVRRWDVITIGNLSRNRYFGESDEKALRAAICTCTLVTGERFRLLVDPSIADKVAMLHELDRRTGVKPDAVNGIFITHEHGDHVAGIEHFPNAPWWAAAPVAEALNRTNRFSRKFEAAPRILFDAIEVIATPGHTATHHALRFDCEGQAVVVAGDSVATRDYWRERRSYYNAIDPALAARTMDGMAATADVIVPGHDNYFRTGRSGDR